MGTPVEELEPLEDPRRGNAGRHSLHDILVIALCTILCGGETCTGMALFGQSKREFLESFLPLRIGIPVMTPSPGCSGFRVRRSPGSGPWDSCASLPKAARGWAVDGKTRAIRNP